MEGLLTREATAVGVMSPGDAKRREEDAGFGREELASMEP